MASFTNLLKNAVQTAIGNDSDLSGSVKGYFFTKQPSNPGKPYIRWETYGGPISFAFGSACKASTAEFFISFHIFSAGSDAAPGASTEAETIQDYLHTVFDGGQLSLAGFRAITLLRDGLDDSVYEEKTDLWHTVVRYKGRANPSPI